MSMTIINPGPLSTIQGRGRPQYMSSGFSPCGAMDEISLRYANILCMNNEFAACIEMTMSGITAVFDCDCVIAITGADMLFCINDNPIKRYRSIEVKRGDVLSSGITVNGFRAYLAVAGGFDIKPELSSYSTDLKIKMGGFEGRKLKRDDSIPFRFNRDALPQIIDFQIPEVYFDDNNLSLRVVLGPQDDMFTKKGIETFLSAEYTVTTESDRMGLRLDGEKIEAKAGTDIISDPIAFGSVQIPSSGKPIIMAADRQTVGGYAKIATVATVDMSLLAQASPGTKITFNSVTHEEALKLYRKKIREINELEGLFFNNGIC